ncbi:hypothetical protein N8350_01950 [Candidatus Nanopelagicales bacterium]|nr:hypothetical protein [Candidatus Nanopelagicales bacterium]
MKEDHMLDEMNTSNKFNFFGVDLPKIDLPKIDLPKIDLPKIDLPTFNIPAIHMDGVNSAIGAVKSAANDGYTTATEAATKVRNSAGHTITLVREAIGV